MIERVPTPFDTLAYANKLKEAGCEPKLAEAQAELQAQALGYLVNENLATKADLKEVSHFLEMKIQDMRHDLLLKLGSLVIGGFTIMTAVLKLL